MRRVYLERGFYVVLCLSCGWRDERPFEVDSERPPGRLPREMVTARRAPDINTMVRLDDVRRRWS